MTDFFDLIAHRQSCRNYSGKEVEREKLIKCIEAARISPSACNSQPWSFTVVNSKEMSPKLAKCLQSSGMNKFTDACPAFIAVTEERGNLTSTVGGVLKQQDYASVDIGIATAHICLSALEQGLSTCIIGWFDEKKIKDLLGINKTKHVRLVIAIGYAADDSLRKKSRKSIDEIAKFIE